MMSYLSRVLSTDVSIRSPTIRVDMRSWMRDASASDLRVNSFFFFFFLLLFFHFQKSTCRLCWCVTSFPRAGREHTCSRSQMKNRSDDGRRTLTPDAVENETWRVAPLSSNFLSRACYKLDWFEDRNDCFQVNLMLNSNFFDFQWKLSIRTKLMKIMISRRADGRTTHFFF